MNDGIPDQVLAVLVDVRVQGREIVVVNALVRLGPTVGSHGFRPSAEEGVSGIQGRNQIEGVGPQEEFGIFPPLLSPLALPFFHHHVTALSNTIGTLCKKKEKRLSRPAGDAEGNIRGTRGKSTHKTRRRTGARIVPVAVVSVLSDAEHHFASVSTLSYPGFTVSGWGQNAF